ncbi:MAG: Fe-S cluster assembly protein SufD [Caulobacter sp.]|nr:Fe-S cluster assembly protein SufD [Caulobacter sp.]
MTLATALKTGDLTQLPSRRDEDWRWTDLRGLIRQVPPASPAFDGEVEAGPFDALADDSILFVNGRQRHAATQGAGETIALRFVSTGEGGGHAASYAIVVEPDTTLVLLESHEGKAGGYLSDVTLDIAVGEGARVERIVLVEDDAEAVNVVTAEVDLAPGATFNQTVLTSGARRQRIETRVNHPGAHAQVRLDGAYLLDGQRHADQTTIVTHGGVDGVTSQLTKGMATDQARGVFQGRIVVAPGADQTDARMGHHALILSDKAEIDAKPELLIFADDVSCAHGNTIGALDEDALFYAEQRGIPELEAKAMLTQAFVGEVIERIEHEGAREIAAAWVAARLGRIG